MSFPADNSVDSKRKQWMHGVADKMRLQNYPVIRACFAECLGTMVLVIFGCGSIAQVVLSINEDGASTTFISISLGWGMAITFGVFFAGGNGPGHINPAITFAQALVGKLSFWLVPLYTISQLAGAFIGGLLLYGTYAEKIKQFAIDRDGGEYLMNTTGAIFTTHPWASTMTCFLDEVLGTALFSAGILTVIDMNNIKVPGHMQPLHVGLLFQTLVGCMSLNTGCSMNPARDLGPRFVLLMFGEFNCKLTARL